MLKVAKFGGSSLADAKQFEKVKSIVEADASIAYIVASAAGKRTEDDVKITDLLYLCHAHLQYGVSHMTVWKMIESRFVEIERQLGIKPFIKDELDKLNKGLTKKTPQDFLVSRGEYFTAMLLAKYLKVKFIDATEFIRFDLDGDADNETTYQLFRDKTQGITRCVIPGFYGLNMTSMLSNIEAQVKVFARGGSDITGAIVSAAAGVDMYENWTDVTGILMADPRVIKNPKQIKTITFAELHELAYMGANVLHEGAIAPVKNKNIPINIRCTNQPQNPGTVILPSYHHDYHSVDDYITGIAGKKGFLVFQIYKSHWSDNTGIMAKALSVFEKFKVSVEHIPSGLDSFSVVVSEEQVGDRLSDIVVALKEKCNPRDIKIVDDICMIATVGENMANTPGISGRLFSGLGGNNINIRLIAQSSDEINIIVGVEGKDFKKAIQVIYNTFVKEGA